MSGFSEKRKCTFKGFYDFDIYQTGQLKTVWGMQGADSVASSPRSHARLLERNSCVSSI